MSRVIRTKLYGMSAAQVEFDGLPGRVVIEPDRAEWLINKAIEDGIDLEIDEHSFHHRLGPNDYGSRFLPELVEKARHGEPYSPPPRKIGKVRVSRYVVHTLWDDV